jgi:hypothetical protein
MLQVFALEYGERQTTACTVLSPTVARRRPAKALRRQIR